MCQPKASIISLLPILRLAVAVGVRREHLPLEPDGFDIKVVIVRNSEEPDIFRTLFPVGLCAASLFAFPRDAILWHQVLRADAMDRRRRFPIAADVDGCGWFQEPDGQREPRVEPFGINV